MRLPVSISPLECCSLCLVLCVVYAWVPAPSHTLVTTGIVSKIWRGSIPVLQMTTTSTHKRAKLFSSSKGQTPAYTVEELHNLLNAGAKIEEIDVRGDSSGLLNRSDLHPVMKVLHERARTYSKPFNRTDNYRVALAIEGGGMRGCVAGGMAVGLHAAELADTIDVVYGASAGSLVGAYFISRQLPYHGPQVYYDMLTTAGKDFIDKRRMLRSVGLGLLDFRLDNYKDMIKDRLGKPVLNLDYLLRTIVQFRKPLDWDAFWENNKLQPLKVVASGLMSRKAVVLSSEAGNFANLTELAECIRASMLLPGVAGPPLRLRDHMLGSNVMKTWFNEYSGRKNFGPVHAGEPLLDAVLTEPIPYRSALAENCTHVLVVRTRPDGVSCNKPLGIFGRLLTLRFFKRKHDLEHMVDYMLKQQNRVVYAEDVLRLNAENKATDATPGPKLLTVALDESIPEVSRLELKREAVFEGVREGFARMYECVHPDPSQRTPGKGREKSREIFPDSILLYDPLKEEGFKDIAEDEDELDSKVPERKSKRQAAMQAIKSFWSRWGDQAAKNA